jgi:glutathione S-transferase
MKKITVWVFRAVPEFAQGLVRDLRVRWALEEAGLPYETRSLEFEDRTSAAYRQRQPFGQVPAFEADGARLFESGAIVHRIAQDSDALLPADPTARADVLAWMFASLNSVEPSIQNLLDMDLQFHDQPWVPLRRPAVVEAVKGRLAVVATWLEGREYLLGRFTAADILMTTTLRFLRHTDLVAGFPVLEAYVRRCEARPAFRKALADQMTDYARSAALAA